MCHLQCNLEVVPQLDSYQVQGKRIKLGLAGNIQKVNASLALQLTNTWMKSQGTYQKKFEDTKGVIRSRKSMAKQFKGKRKVHGAHLVCLTCGVSLRVFPNNKI